MTGTTERRLARTHAFVLAGGQGQRLHPLTASRPKPAVSFGGIFRIIDFTLSNCLHSGLGRVSLLTQYKYEELHRYVREGWRDLWHSASGHREPLMCNAPVSGKRYRGTADAIFQNAELLNADSEFVLVLSGDHIYQMDYRDLLQQHLEANAELTIATVEHPLAEASHFGVVEVDDAFRVTGFQEKPANPRPLPSDPSMALVSMGVYVFSTDVLLRSLKAVCDSGRGSDFGHDVIPTLIHSGHTYAYDFRDKTRQTPRYWRDIGTVDAYYAANMDLVGSNPTFDPYFNKAGPSSPTRHPAPTQGLRARVHADAHIAQSVLSPGVRIERGAEIDRAILLPGVRIGNGARLRRAIVEEGVEIPDGFHVGFDLNRDRRQHTVTAAGIVVISETPASVKPATVRLAFSNVRAPAAKRAHAGSVQATA